MKHFPWFEIVLVIIVMSFSFYAAESAPQNFPQRWFTRDDAYYYFKVAQNISEGHGSTFDGINPTNGYHPLWMAICIPIFSLARFDPILPLRVLLLVMSGLSLATGILLYRLLSKIFAPFIGALAAIYWVLSAQVQNSLYRQGLESGIAAFFIVLLLYKLYHFEISWRIKGLSRKELIMLSVLAALTVFSRLDLVFFALLIGLWILFRGHPLRYYLPLDVLAIIFSVLLAFTVKFGFPDYFENEEAAAIMIVVALIIRLATAYFLGLYQDRSAEEPLKLLARLGGFAAVSSAVIVVLMLGIARVLHFNTMPRTILAMDAVVVSLLIGGIRFFHRDLHSCSEHSRIPGIFDALKCSWKQWLAEGSIYYGIVVGSLCLYMLWNKLFADTFSPVSGQIKRWWGSFLVNIYGKYPKSVLTFFGVKGEDGSVAWKPIDGIIEKGANKLKFLSLDSDLRFVLVLLLASALFYLVLRFYRHQARSAILQTSLLPLFVGCMLQVIYYNYAGYSAEKEWYWVAESITIVMINSLIISLISHLLRESLIKNVITWGLVIAVGLFLSISFWNKIKVSMRHDTWGPDITFDDSVKLLEDNTEPGSIIGMTGGGTTAYFIHNRTIVNMDGLINSKEYFESLQKGTAGEYLQKMGVDYVFANRYILSSRPYKGMFDPYLTETGVEYDGKDLMKFGK